MTISVPNPPLHESVPEIRTSFNEPKTPHSMGLDFAAKNRNDSEAFLDTPSNNPSGDESESSEEENYLNLDSTLSKDRMRNSRSFVLSRKFPGRTAQTDQAVLIALIDESIIYVKGRSGVRPGNRKLKTATNLNIETISFALNRLCAKGWVKCYSKGSRSGTASVWRVNFEDFWKFGFDHSFDYKTFNHPLAEHFRLWTKFGLGIRALHILNFLYQNHNPPGQFALARKSAIEEGSGYSWQSVTNGLLALMNMDLVIQDDNQYLVNKSAVEDPGRFLESISDYFSIPTRVEKIKKQHQLERRASAPFRSMERESNIQRIITINTSKKQKRFSKN